MKKMSEELIESIWEAANIASKEREILNEDYFEEWDFTIYMKPDGTIKLLRESEYYRETPEGWKIITYDGHENWELTEPEELAEIVSEWLEKTGAND